MRKFAASTAISLVCLIRALSAQAATLNVTGLPSITGTEGVGGPSTDGGPGGNASAVAVAQVGSGLSINNAITPGQSFSIVSPVVSGPLTVAVGSMGAGGIGGSLAYQQTATFTLNAGGSPFLIDLISSSSLGTGFDSATFQVSDNGNVVLNQSFASLASAEAFFSTNNLINVMLATGFKMFKFPSAR